VRIISRIVRIRAVRMVVNMLMVLEHSPATVLQVSGKNRFSGFKFREKIKFATEQKRPSATI
jgi:hypothetical protein